MATKFNQIIKIKNKKIGKGQPVFIIAEAGVNHNGDYELAEKLVREAKKVGADCVKFQTFRAQKLVTEKSPKAGYQLLSTDPKESQFAMLQSLELGENEHFKLNKLCNQLGILFISTPYNFADVDFLARIPVPAYKLASMHLTESPMVKYVAKQKRPVIMSTGMSTLEDIKIAVKNFGDVGNRDLIILQCTTNYPTSIKDVNLRTIKTIKKATGAVTGYSDHTLGIEASILAVGAGAEIIEKHFTLDKKMKGPDHASSADPREFAQMVKRIRDAEVMMGSAKKDLTAVEKLNKKGMKRSLVAVVPIKAGKKIKATMLDFKRPEGGLSPNFYYKVIGKMARKNIEPDQKLTKNDFIL